MFRGWRVFPPKVYGTLLELNQLYFLLMFPGWSLISAMTNSRVCVSINSGRCSTSEESSCLGSGEAIRCTGEVEEFKDAVSLSRSEAESISTANIVLISLRAETVLADSVELTISILKLLMSSDGEVGDACPVLSVTASSAEVKRSPGLLLEESWGSFI